MSKTAFVFPGQGSQIVGMGITLASASRAAQDVFSETDEALGQNLFKLMRDGPIEDLTLTENAQPAIMASSMAVLRVLEKEAGVEITKRADCAAGHSLGEYSALCASGALSLAETARLLKKRGQAMQAAVPVGTGAMAAILGATIEEVSAFSEAGATHGQVCDIANDNAPGQVVISGHKDAVAKAVEAAKSAGKKAMPLPVSAPFHCALMKPAAAKMETELATAKILPPFLPVFANVIAAPVTAPDEIRSLLVQQVCGRVRWRESILAMVDAGVETFVEIGTGKVLSGMIKRIHKDAVVKNIETPDDIDAFLKA